MAATARIELPHAGASGVPFMKRRTLFSRISSSIFDLSSWSAIVTHYTHPSTRSNTLLRDRGLDRERVQLARVRALAEGVLDQPVLIDAVHVLELGRGDVDAQMVAAALVDHLDHRPREGALDQ